MARRIKTIEITIKYHIYEDEKELLDKYGYAYKYNAAEAAEKHAKNVAYTIKEIEKKEKQLITERTKSTTMTEPTFDSRYAAIPAGCATHTSTGTAPYQRVGNITESK